MLKTRPTILLGSTTATASSTRRLGVRCAATTMTKLRFDQKHAGTRALRERSREIDRRRRLAVSDRGTGDRDDRHARGSVLLFDHVTERAVLLGLERGRRDEAHEVAVEAFDVGI